MLSFILWVLCSIGSQLRCVQKISWLQIPEQSFERRHVVSYNITLNVEDRSYVFVFMASEKDIAMDLALCIADT